MLTKLRYALSILKNSYTYTNSINDHFLRYYLRHNKIIGWHKGQPVYSAFLTPGLSKPLGNLLARRMISGLIEKPVPGMINLSVIDTCNAKCEHCSFFGAMDKKEDILNTQQMKEVIDACLDFGICIINFVGGEPLLRKDLAELISHVDSSRAVSSVYTNGWFLKEKVDELKKAGAMMIITSLDSHDPKQHDQFRKLPGLYDRAVEGIRYAQKRKMLTAISTTVTADDLDDGSFEKRIEMAKQLGVNELIVFDTMPVGMYSHRADLTHKPINRKKLFALIDRFNAKEDYPGIFAYAHFRDQHSFGCSAGRNYFYLTPYGEMCPCDFTAKPIGSLQKESLAELWWKLVDQRKNKKYMNACCEQKDSNDLFPII